MWFRSEDTSSLFSPVLDKRSNSQGYRGYHLYLYRGRLGLQLADGSYHNDLGPLVADSAWHHVAVTVDRDREEGITWYVDGVAVESTQPSLPSVPAARPGSLDSLASLKIGGSSFNRNRFRGEMDEVAIIRRVLEPDEVSALFLADEVGYCSR